MIKDSDLPSMGWYAQTIASLCVRCIIGGVAYLFASRSQLLNERAILTQIAGWIAVISAILMMLYIVQHEWRRWIIGQ
jgi:hypothetical protein